ncbi:hypothetical protein B0O99DRAFT_148757 [Bisporella sp. PMI_857]|nr:hypothetical protein B0O99DRAFT_148757 [Bisporella sp. PMI_857]
MSKQKKNDSVSVRSLPDSPRLIEPITNLRWDNCQNWFGWAVWSRGLPCLGHEKVTLQFLLRAFHDVSMARLLCHNMIGSSAYSAHVTLVHVTSRSKDQFELESLNVPSGIFNLQPTISSFKQECQAVSGLALGRSICMKHQSTSLRAPFPCSGQQIRRKNFHPTPAAAAHFNPPSHLPHLLYICLQALFP